MTIYYFDLVNGNDANDGLSFANRKKFPVNMNDMAAGTEYRIMKTPDPVNLGISVTWPSQVMTTSAYAITGASLTSLIKNIWISSDNAMAGVTNMTVTRDIAAPRIAGGAATKIVCAAAFTTGKMAYYYFGGTSRNYSGFNGLTFWIKSSVAIAANTLRFDLCSDNSGDTPVYSFTLDKAIAIANTWLPITIPYGSALGSTAINTFTVRALLDPGTSTIYISGLNACYTDKLNYTNLIGANTTDYPFWYVIGELNSSGTITFSPYAGSVYFGNYYSYTGDLYVKETVDVLKSSLNAAATDIAFIKPLSNIASDSTEDNPVIISGGWNETDMSTQTGDTAINFSYQSGAQGCQIWYAGWDNPSSGLTKPAHVKINSFTTVNGANLFAASYCSTFKVSNCNFIDNNFIAKTPSGVESKVLATFSFDNCTFVCGSRYSTLTTFTNSQIQPSPIIISNSKSSRLHASFAFTDSGSGFNFNNVISYIPYGSNAYSGFFKFDNLTYSSNNIFNNVLNYGGNVGLDLGSSGNHYITNSDLRNTGTNKGFKTYNSKANIYVENSYINSSQDIDISSHSCSIVIKNCNNTVSTQIFKLFGSLTKATDYIYGTNTFSWSVVLNTGNGFTQLTALENMPINMLPVASHKLGAIPVVAGKLVTTTLRVKLGNVSRGKIGLAAGNAEAFNTYPSNVWCDNSTTAWQVITHTCTPTRDGIFEPHVCFSYLTNSTTMNFCDFTCTQAD